jgi:hypothetical protein
VEALVIWVFLAIALQTLLESARVPLGPQGTAAMVPGLAAGIGAIGWVLIVSPRPRRLGWRWTGWWRQALVGVLAAAACAIPILALYAGIQQAYVRYMVSHQTVPGAMSQEHPLAPLFVVTQGWQAKALLAAAACLVMPAVEETLFRGILYRGLRREWAAAPAALASALVFAVGHLSVTRVVPYLLLGLLFAYLYERSGSLVAPWTAHAVFNAFNVAILMTITG